MWKSGLLRASRPSCYPPLGHTVTLSSDFTLHHKQMCQLSVLAGLLKNNQERGGHSQAEMAAGLRLSGTGVLSRNPVCMLCLLT